MGHFWRRLSLSIVLLLSSFNAMRNLLIEITYNGSHYHGWQVQDNALTVQERMQDSVEKLFGSRLDISGCSRTDSGVHANQYYFHMLTESHIPCVNIKGALSTNLPDDIAVISCREVPLDFHARYSCTGKEYCYKIWNADYRSPFLTGLAYNYRYNLDCDKLDKASKHFLGTHDFSSFCSIKSDIKNKIRTISYAGVRKEGSMVVITFRGDGFLYNMARIMTGTLIFVAEGKIKAEDIPGIIKSKNRGNAGKTAPASGLYLNRVFY